jgi:hypothetical protein
MFKFDSIDITKLPLKNLTILMLAVVSIVSIQQCSQKTLEIETNDGNWKFKYTMMVDSFEVKTNEQGDLLAYQAQLLVSNDQAKELLENENSELKKLSSHVKTKVVTEIKEVYIPFGEVVNARTVSDTNEVLIDTSDTKPYKPFGVTTSWYSLSGKVFDEGLIVDSLSVKNEITTNIGWKRDKWYKKKYAVVEIKSKNPHTQIVGVQNVTVRPDRKKFYETNAFKVGVGIVGGFYINNRLNK